MVKFTFGTNDGMCIGLGISRGNVNRLMEGRPIRVDLKQMGITINNLIMIYFGETEQDLHDAVKEFITPETKVTIDPRAALNEPQLGSTGTFSEGKIDPSDEGDLRLGVAADSAHGVVRVEFGTNVKWLALPPDGARELARLLIANADQVKPQ